MATENNTTRRALMKALPVGLMAALASGNTLAAAELVTAPAPDVTEGEMEQLKLHAAEVHRLLSETMPADGKIGPFFQIDADGAVLATGPDGLTFRSKKGGWRQEGNGWGSTERGTI